MNQEAKKRLSWIKVFGETSTFDLFVKFF